MQTRAADQPDRPEDHPVATAAEAGDVTRLIEASASGDDSARDRLVALLYAEFHRMASYQMQHERPGHTLGATGLVSETYLRLFGGGEGPGAFGDRRAFFAAAANAMRRVLIDHARGKQAQKRGGRARRAVGGVEPDAVAAAASLDPADFLALDEEIQRLEQVDARAAAVTRLRFFGGRDMNEIAELLSVSARTVKRDWEFARAWLRDRLDRGPDGGSEPA